MLFATHLLRGTFGLSAVGDLNPLAAKKFLRTGLKSVLIYLFIGTRVRCY